MFEKSFFAAVYFWHFLCKNPRKRKVKIGISNFIFTCYIQADKNYLYCFLIYKKQTFLKEIVK